MTSTVVTGILVTCWPLFAFALAYLSIGAWKSTERLRRAVMEHAEGIPRKELRSDAARIDELAQWNAEWAHPDTGNFYYWSNVSQSYKERIIL